jgi:hypothetical protein
MSTNPCLRPAEMDFGGGEAHVLIQPHVQGGGHEIVEYDLLCGGGCAPRARFTTAEITVVEPSAPVHFHVKSARMACEMRRTLSR